MHPFHKEILAEIKKRSGKATQHTFLNSYLGNTHPRYPISSPALRSLAKEWMAAHREIPADELCLCLTSLIKGESATEKFMAGILLDYAKPPQRQFDIHVFEEWLEHLQGWAEIDTLCTGQFSKIEIPQNFKVWKPFLKKLSKSKSIEKRRASLVFFCSPVSQSVDDSLAIAALDNVRRLKHEREILITKAISWLLRSLIRHHREKVELYLSEEKDSLPAIAVRETMVKLKTGKKSG